MIEDKVVTKSNNEVDFPFSGDPKKIWKCRIVDSNLGVKGDPVVNGVRNGRIYMTIQDRSKNATFDVIYYEGHEVKLSENAEVVKNLSALPSWFMSSVNKLAHYSKKVAVGGLVLIVLSIVFAVVNYKFDISGFLDEYQKYNAANGARVLEQTVKNLVDTIDDPFYSAPGIKAIEEEQNLSYKSMFTRVDEDLYVMKNIFVDADGKAVLMDYGDADDKCDDLGGYVLPVDLQQKILTKKTNFTIRKWGGQPEWTGTSRGLFSDDYVVNLKNGNLIEGTYNMGGLIYGDAEDVKVAARCGVLRATFLEEE